MRSHLTEKLLLGSHIAVSRDRLVSLCKLPLRATVLLAEDGSGATASCYMRQVAAKLTSPFLPLHIYWIINFPTGRSRMPENRHMWEEGLQKRALCLRDINTARLIQNLALEVKWSISPPDTSLSCLSLCPVWAHICICASRTADAKRS